MAKARRNDEQIMRQSGSARAVIGKPVKYLQQKICKEINGLKLQLQFRLQII